MPRGPVRLKGNVVDPDGRRSCNRSDGLVAMLRASNGAPPGKHETNSRLHRFGGEGDEPGARDCWYVPYVRRRRPAGAIGSGRLGVRKTCRAEVPRPGPAELERRERKLNPTRGRWIA